MIIVEIFFFEKKHLFNYHGKKGRKHLISNNNNNRAEFSEKYFKLQLDRKKRFDFTQSKTNIIITVSTWLNSFSLYFDITNIGSNQMDNNNNNGIMIMEKQAKITLQYKTKNLMDMSEICRQASSE